MSKFKAGDKVRCVNNYNFGNHLTEGKVYVVLETTIGGYVRIKPDHDIDVGGYGEDRFELVQEENVLTPEEVFAHLRKGTKLQWYHKNFDKWCEPVCRLDQIQVNELLDYKWRIKPEPEVIELNGKKYREIVD